MEVEWTKMPWCESCEECLEWNRFDRTWECPSCGDFISAEDIEDEES